MPMLLPWGSYPSPQPGVMVHPAEQQIKLGWGEKFKKLSKNGNEGRGFSALLTAAVTASMGGRGRQDGAKGGEGK